ncbi:uncharacterized protein LOC123667375 [Melitaea cinxia]|uniref:uncharacterized protein LOC123665150 n=1 Tax=Melitaea cinxia TaxID=113334 RepID=UPI001E270F92|nr:uncharacterized protein LOC123665150 [Melitaea cinxia]XP_045457243.1 uncharacterized protein LOC123667375 [Melitaea cinxia]
METKTKTKLPQEGTCASGKGESLRASSDARCPFDSGEGTLCYCDSPHMGVDVVPGKGGATSARNTDSDNSLRSGGSNEPSLSRTGLPSRDRKGRFLSRQKGPSKGQDKGGNRFAVLAADDKTDTDTDMVSGSPDRHIALTGRRKRPSSSTFASGRDGSDTEAEGAGLAKINTARRGKARGTTAGPSREKFLKPAPVRPEPVNILIDNESDVGSSIVDDVVALNAQELRARAGEGLAVILEVARKSGNLKGEFVAKLKRSATDLSEVVDAFASRTEADEVRRLRAENRRFRIEIEAMKTELKAMRRGFAEAKTEAAANAAAAAAAAANASVAGPPATLPVAAMLEEFKHSLTCSLGDMMNVRLAQIEERLPPAPSVRPQLGAGGPRRPETAATTSAAPSTVAREETWATVVKRGKGKRKGKGKSSAPPSTPAVEGRTAAPAVKPTGKPAAASSARPAAKPTAKPTKQSGRPATKATVKAKFKAPKTAAVVVQLQPAAVEKGQTYDSIFRSAEDTVKLEELGIERILFRHTATGARMLEIPGSDKEEKADRLASRLREALSDVATVVRPVKTAQVRISGLDDTATPERVAAAVAKATSSDVGTVRVGAIRSGFGGMGSTVVACPVSVAKALTEGGRLLIGWSSVRVSALEALPMRCFKCMGLGHTRPKCPASVDRGNLCFKCGNAGHKVASCPEKTPRCVVCAEGGKPSGHIMCGRRCRPATSKGKGALGTRAPRETASQTAADGVAPPAAAGEVEVVMSE